MSIFNVIYRYCPPLERQRGWGKSNFEPSCTVKFDNTPRDWMMMWPAGMTYRKRASTSSDAKMKGATLKYLETVSGQYLLSDPNWVKVGVKNERVSIFGNCS